MKENRRLQTASNVDFVHFQEELKMRESQSKVGLIEIREKLDELQDNWREHEKNCQTTNQPTSDAYDLIAHQLISLKIREAQLDCDKKQLEEKIVEIETQKQVLHNQIKRQDEEIQRIKIELDQSRSNENEIRSQCHELKNQLNDREIRVKEKRFPFRRKTKISSTMKLF